MILECTGLLAGAGYYYVGATTRWADRYTHPFNPEGVDVEAFMGSDQLRPVATTSTRNSAIGNRAHIPVYYPGTGSGTHWPSNPCRIRGRYRGIDIKAATVNTYRVTGVFTRAGHLLEQM
jgi:hypothetical protein